MSQKQSKLLMRLLNSEAQSDRMPKLTSKIFYKFAINLEIKIWYNLKSELRINKLNNHPPGDSNQNKLWSRKDRKNYKTKERMNKKKKENNNKNWKKYDFIYLDEYKSKINVQRDRKIHIIRWKWYSNTLKRKTNKRSL